MVKAIVCRGEIRPLEPLPSDWQEGQPLRVELLHQVRLWPLNANTARLYGAIYLELRRQGRVLSQAARGDRESTLS